MASAFARLARFLLPTAQFFCLHKSIDLSHEWDITREYSAQEAQEDTIDVSAMGGPNLGNPRPNIMVDRATTGGGGLVLLCAQRVC